MMFLFQNVLQTHTSEHFGLSFSLGEGGGVLGNSDFIIKFLSMDDI